MTCPKRFLKVFFCSTDVASKRSLDGILWTKLANRKRFIGRSRNIFKTFYKTFRNHFKNIWKKCFKNGFCKVYLRRCPTKKRFVKVTERRGRCRLNENILGTFLTDEDVADRVKTFHEGSQNVLCLMGTCGTTKWMKT